MAALIDESSLTNVFLLLQSNLVARVRIGIAQANVSRIRWKRFCCRSTEALIRRLLSPTATAGSGARPSDPLLATYATLLSSGIPCVWRMAEYASPPPPDTHDLRAFKMYTRSDIVFLPHELFSAHATHLNRGRLAHGVALVPSLNNGTANHSPFGKVPSSVSPTESIRTAHAGVHDEHVYRELWVFDYSGTQDSFEPQVDADLLLLEQGDFGPDEIYGDSSSPRQTQTTEYGLFINALNNLAERSLLKSGIVRIGESYLLRPAQNQGKDLDLDESTPSDTRLAFQCDFFLTLSNLMVHITMDYVKVRAITALDYDSLLQQQWTAKPQPFPVVLCPHGLRATLLPASPASNLKAKAVLSDWQTYFGFSSCQPGDRLLPATVQVQLDDSGIIMDYPSSLVYYVADGRSHAAASRPAWIPTAGFPDRLDDPWIFKNIPSGNLESILEQRGQIDGSIDATQEAAQLESAPRAVSGIRVAEDKLKEYMSFSTLTGAASSTTPTKAEPQAKAKSDARDRMDE
ncbi:uncharacterized protein BJ171DRAFT_579311 [Polychytrium aggregatum]|uniref:uncharacterized protein n=1 Tax=Polychytrium aggregatum TaxID=110093 RepID=UPI0022FE7100|nr:uncharacterized protein BJ171DRAFT_579311 [Polychytrium aggregatum]KAI9206954.1 hypothetical protein BJ171DRAFT_579311 [Polychytrium aggregatum]